MSRSFFYPFPEPDESSPNLLSTTVILSTLILSFCLYLDFLCVLLLPVFQPKVFRFLISLKHATYHSLLLDHSSSILERAYVRRILITLFYTA